MGHIPGKRKNPEPKPSKLPGMSIYWADTKELLTHEERKDLEFAATVVSVTPREILLEMPSKEKNKVGKKVCIVSIFDINAPLPPKPRLDNS